MFGPFTRGVRNTFRNPLRTISVATILGISLGLVLAMLASRSAVDKRIAEVKSSIGNTITISPAGARGFLGGGEPLTNDQVKTVGQISHVTSVNASIDAQLRTDQGDTSLTSSIEAGTLGGRGFRTFSVGGGSRGQNVPTNFTPPIFAIGTNNPSEAGEQVGQISTLSSGALFDGTIDDNVALVGKNLADKNTLTVGSTFKAYNTDVKVVGIFDAGNEFANNAVVFPLQTLQRLSTQTGQVASMVAHVDSVENLSSTTSVVKTKLGSAADVTSSEDSVKNAVAPLQNISQIATISFIGALIAAAVITLLSMVMIVRERRKEIAVLKAIGASDLSVTTQFVVEATSLSLLGGVVGSILGFVLTNPILHALLTSSQQQPGGPGGGFTRGGGGPGFVRFAAGGFNAVRGSVRNLQAVVDFHLVLYGFLAAVLIAIVGSAFPAWLIGKVRPAEVLRSE